MFTGRHLSAHLHCLSVPTHYHQSVWHLDEYGMQVMLDATRMGMTTRQLDS
jgi:hypothetical protein